jgi:fengycin family lipopeptide synthetase D
LNAKLLSPCTIIPKKLYVNRDADKQIKSIIQDMGRPGYILVARQMGKTNLLLNAKRELEDAENIFVYFDLSNLFESSRDCFRSIIDMAIETHEEIFAEVRVIIYQNRDKLELPPHKEHERELRLLLKAVRGKIVITLDEIGSLAKVSFSDEIFAQIRSIYFFRVNFPEYERLTYILAGVAEPSELIKNKNISPFNIGEKIYLDDFSYREFLSFLEQADLNFSSDVVERIFYWANGNPRITWDLCSELEDIYLEEQAELAIRDVDDAVKKLYLTTVNKAPIDHIRHIVGEDKEIRNAVILIKNNKGNALSNEMKNKLYLAGIIKSDYHSTDTSIKNKVIERSLSDQWLVSTEHYPLTPAQLRVWFLSQLDGEQNTHYLQFSFKLEGQLEYNVLKKAFGSIIQRHETLRTTFIIIGEAPWQSIFEKKDFHLSIIDLSKNITPEINIQELAQKDAIKPFDLIEGPLFRATLFKLAENRHILLVTFHNIIFDEQSIGIFLRELSHFYQCQIDGTKSTLRPLEFQYKDHSSLQDKLLKNKILDFQKEYWLEKLSKEVQILNLPFDYSRSPILGNPLNGDRILFSINLEVLQSLQKLCREKGANLFSGLLAIVKILLYRYSEQEDMSIVSSTVGRKNPKLIGLIGLFENLLVFRDLIQDRNSFNDILEKVKQTEKEALEHCDYPFEKVLEELLPRRDTRPPGPFNVMVVLQDATEVELFFRDITVSPYSLKYRKTHYDLKFVFKERKNDLLLEVEFSTDLFSRGTIERMGGHFFKIMHSILVKGEESNEIEGLEILSEKERLEILHEFNNTFENYSLDKTISEIFEEQSVKTPDSIALVYKNKRLSYRELNERANRVANFLREKYLIQPDDIVGLITDKSECSIIGLLGILKSGGAYLPIDSDYPQERIIFMIKDCDCKLTLKANYSGFYYKETICTRIDLEFVNILPLQNIMYSNPEPINLSHHLAYVIYTSGSTGRPKGVMIEHRSVINLVKSFHRRVYIDFEGFVNVLIFSSFSFDFSVIQIFCALLQGHALNVIGDDVRKNLPTLASYLEKHSIDVMDMVPSFFSVLVNIFLPKDIQCTLKHILLGGELIIKERLIDFYSISPHKNINITNLYGPTECCVVSTSSPVSESILNEEGHIPIGKPINNVEIYILNKHCQLLPVGVPGEICISGEGLARGYVDRPELTWERFSDNPFKVGARLYRTGDNGKWLPNGNIEFLGRRDYQVKVRGFRIELGEIEQRLVEHKMIKEAVVLARKDEKGDGYLCAYYISDVELTPSELREFLSTCLPDYMVPNHWLRLEKIPLTPSGKVDRKLLPEPRLWGIENKIKPRDEIEERMVEIWAGVLDREKVKIGIEDDFFEMGGNSLIATILIARVNKDFNIKVPLVKIFDMGKLREMADFVKRATEDQFWYIRKSEEKEYYLLSSAQRRIYFHQTEHYDDVAFNIPFIAIIDGNIDRNKLNSAFKKLIERHEGLRTSFLMVRREPVQRVHRDVEFAITYVDSKTLYENAGIDCTNSLYREEETFSTVIQPISKTTNFGLIVKNCLKPFRLPQAPLFRVFVISIGEKRYLLVFDMHKIVADDFSKNILISDLNSLYNKKELLPIRIQSKDFSEFQAAKINDELMKRQLEYWIKELSDELPILDLPTDYARPEIQKYRVESLKVEINRDKKEKLELFISKVVDGVSMYMFFLAIFNVLLFKYTNQEDIIVGTTVAGRPHPDLMPIIGLYENTLALRNYPVASKTFYKLLEEVKTRTVEAFNNQDYRFEDLIERLSIRKNRRSDTLFRVVFLDLGYSDTSNEETNLKISVDYDYLGAKYSGYDISVLIKDFGEVLCLEFIYAQELFKRETVEGISKHFFEIIENVIEDKEIKLDEINLSIDLDYDSSIDYQKQVKVDFEF